ncbi:MAG: hypothetical protein NTW67_04060 [Candidatus Woesearchaeota archaeon]|nr:hypothetical protein [Candidatus Woesearchaeota archaeon]
MKIDKIILIIGFITAIILIALEATARYKTELFQGKIGIVLGIIVIIYGILDLFWWPIYAKK